MEETNSLRVREVFNDKHFFYEVFIRGGGLPLFHNFIFEEKNIVFIQKCEDLNLGVGGGNRKAIIAANV